MSSEPKPVEPLPEAGADDEHAGAEAVDPLADTRARSPLVIAVAVAIAVVVAVLQPSLPLAVLRGVLVLVLVPCAVVDLELRLIPNRLTGPAAVVALVLGLALDAGHEPRRLVWTAIVAGFLLLAALVNPAGMGMGDVKLLAVMGLFLGRAVVIALMLALVGSVLTGFVIASRRGIKVARKTGLPFGPYLAVGGVLAAVLGDPLLHAYLSAH